MYRMYGISGAMEGKERMYRMYGISGAMDGKERMYRMYGRFFQIKAKYLHPCDLFMVPWMSKKIFYTHKSTD